jgi:hypothetical protein
MFHVGTFHGGIICTLEPTNLDYGKHAYYIILKGGWKTQKKMVILIFRSSNYVLSMFGKSCFFKALKRFFIFPKSRNPLKP